MEQPPQPVDRTKELAELLGKFAEVMTALSNNFKLLKVWETLLQSSDSAVQETLSGSGMQVQSMISQQYEAAKQNQEILKKSLDEIAATLKEKGQGFAIQGYEEVLATLQ